MWPLALFYRVYPHTLTLLCLQDVAVVGGELVVVVWAKEIVTTTGQTRYNGAWLLGLVTVLLVITPWSWFTIRFRLPLRTLRRPVCSAWLPVICGLVVTVGCRVGAFDAQSPCAAAGSLLVPIGAGGLIEPGQVAPVAVGVALAGFGWLATGVNARSGCSSGACSSARCTATCLVTRRATWA